ncbi:amino acid adenylation domain-containing protein [Ascidiimonas sp. W6]|uniref:amino acid adenylation domain-containing protein n=1 Tax=Ascidiimonas meishanensis TaxID=3128903 RepID=UPI0030EE25B9
MEELLNKLKSLNITLSENDNQIDVFDPDENLSQQIITEIKDYKSEILQYLKNLESPSRSPYIQQAPKREYYSLSPSQKRMFFLYEVDKSSVAYNMPQIYKVKGNLDIEKMELVFNQLLSRHEILRTNFEVINGVPVQKIHKKVTLKITHYHVDEEDVEEVVRAFISPFDLAKDCLLRIGVIEHSAYKILMIDMHHIIGDGMSHAILVNDFKVLYEGGKLEPLQLQYKDYIEWQIGEEYQLAIEEDKHFWLDKFKDEITPLELPTDFKRPAIKSNQGAMHFFEINATQTAQLKAIAMAQGTSLFVIIQTLYNILIYKLTNQTDIIIGVPTRGRDHVALENMLGMFVNTISLRNKLVANETFVDLLATIRDNVLNSFDHQAFQYDKLVEELGIKRSTNRNPIFDIAFSFDSFGDSGVTISDLEFELYEREFKNAKFDITLIASEQKEGLNLMFEYSTDLFKSKTVERFAEYFKSITKQVVTNKNLKINEIDIISKSEKNLILNTFNLADLETQNNTTLLDAFSLQVTKNADRSALVYNGTTITYAALDKRSNQFAQYLLDQGVKKEELIPICVNRSIEMIVGIIGILKSGAAFVPIDPEYPTERISYMLEDVDAKMIVTEKPLKDILGTGYEKIYIDIPENYENYKEVLPLPSIQQDHLGYVIYTSGTTGKPKGVKCTQEGVLNMVMNQIQVIGLTSHDNVLQFASFAFDAFISELFTTLIAGAKLAIPTKQIINSIEEVAKFIREEKITVATLPPSYQAILRQNIFNMKVIISAGEALNAELTKSLIEKGLRVINAYGPTENTVCTTMSVHPLLENNIVTIGKPLQGVKVYILNNDGQLCPVGVTGELCVSGVQLAKGYLNRPGITKEKFIKKSFQVGTVISLYKTGDLARWLPDGNIEFIGRKDNQVKLRGYRIELEEIESAMSKIPEIQGSAVVLNEEQQSLIAYYTTKPKVELWPSIAEFFIYDDVVYKSMYTHLSRNEKYKEALKKVIKGKTVLEIGPGPEAILTRLCIECGAAKVYTVEILEETYLKAKAKIESEGLEDKITLIHGDVMKVDLPQIFDYCVSEIVGSIGGSEGAAVLINHVKKFMKNPQHMIPARSLTKISAISLDESMFDYAFSEVANHYVEQIFSNYGENFEFRLCVKNVPKENIIADYDVFEDLDYTSTMQYEQEHDAKITFNKDSTFNGFYVWMDLYMDNEINLDIIEDPGSWLPIFMPVAYPGIPVKEGDYLEMKIQRKLASNNINPDFFIKGQLYREGLDSISVEFNSYHYENIRSGNPFYEKLFKNGIQIQSPGLNTTFIKEQLSTFLPEYMVPSNYISIDKIPLTSNGKVNKKALAAIQTKHEIKKPEKAIEKGLIDLWAETLKIDKETISVDSDFFVLGGHSLMAISMVHKLNERYATEIQLEEIFETSVLSELAELILQRQDTGKIQIPKAEDKGYFALSSAQKRLYFVYELDKSSIMYNVPQFYTIKGKLDTVFLAQVFQQLVERHEALRTNFEVVDSVVMQKIKSAKGFTIQFGEAIEKDIDSEIEKFIKPYTLNSDYPFRVKLVTLAAEEYLLLIDMHHIVSDGLSYEILLKDFWNLYNKEQLEPLQFQYKDYAEWQQSDAQKELVKAHRAFWMEQYKNPVIPLELPTSYPRPAKKSGKGASLEFTLSIEETAKLKKISQSEGATMFMLLLTIYNTFLNKLSNQEDIVVGVSSSGRPNSEFDNVVGIFLNSIPLRNTVNSDLTFLEFLREVKSNTLDCFNHQLFQYDELVEALQIGRNMSRNPLFDAILVYQEETIKGAMQNAELDINMVNKEHEYSKFDLALFAKGGEENLKLQFTYATDLFNEDTVYKFISYFKKIVIQILENIDTKLASITILSEDEQKIIISRFNAKKDLEEAHRITVVDMFEEMVLEDPENEAVCYNDTILTYEELNDEANKLARYLMESHHISNGDIVAIKMQRSEKLIISMLGVLKTGAAYLPIDYYMPEKRTAYILSDSLAKCVISDQAINVETQNVSWEQSEKWISNECNNINKKMEAQDNVYIIYTSGTTGKPKGVCIPNRSLYNYITWLKSSYNIDFRDSTVLFSSHAYDLCYTSLWGSILSGGTLHLVNDSKHFDPAEVASCILENSISFIKLTPSHLKLLYKSKEFVENIKRNSLRLILLGGEPIDLNDVAFYQEIKRSVQFVNHYGPTETTIGAIAHNIKKKDIFSTENVIGKGIDNNEIFILNKNLALVPTGIKGEICIAGLGVSNGYLNKPELTSEKFIENPYATGDHDKKLYKTGDLGRFREDGNIEFLGRIDDQVKIRGHRIELKEVEMHLNALESIQESKVLIEENQLGENQLVAYVIITSAKLNEEDIIAEMSLNLPDYMVPKRYIQLEAFPLTLNGKIDKKALPKFNTAEVKTTLEEGAYTEVQQKLRNLWADILKLDQQAIGLNNDFFNLGGHSLLALEMIYKISELFLVEISIDTIFEKKTILELAEYINELDKKIFIKISKANEREYYPLSPAQRRLYFIYEFDKTSLAYNMPGIYRMKASVDVKRIEKIFRELIKRHESLRTNFRIINNEIVQKIGDWEIFQIAHTTAEEAQIPDIVKDFVRPFDLSKDYLLRVGLITIKEGGYILMTDKHHIVSDGLSREVLLKDFWTLYQGDTLEPLQLQYKDYAVWQENIDQVELLEQHKAYWLQKFEMEIAHLNLNTDFERPSVKTSNGASMLFDINTEKSEKLKQLAEDNGVTLFMLFLSLYNVLLSKLSTSEDIVVGVPVSGRHHADLEGIVGMFVNTLPLRNQSHGTLSFTKFLTNVKENSLEAFNNYLYQYENLVEELDIERDTSRNPIFDVLFSYDKKEKNENVVEHDDLIIPYKLEKNVVKFDLHMALKEIDGQLLYDISYNTDLFKEETIRQFSQYFELLTDQVLTNPKVNISELTILSSSEYDRIVHEFNDTDKNIDLTKTLIDLFTEQVQKTPGKVALKYNETEVTYMELEERANALANHLVTQGIDTGEVIGIYLDRSLEMIVAILGILKAGCSYIPMNTKQPVSRTRYMMSDADIKLIITSTIYQKLLSAESNTVLIDMLSWEELSKEAPELNIDSTAQAYVIYTSGSTGNPKGVSIKHKGIVNLVNNQQQAFGISESDRILQFSPIYFDASAEQVWLSLLSGSTLVLIDEATLIDQQRLNAYLAAQKVTHFHATPSFLETLMLEENTNLRRIIAGGEPCKSPLATKFKDYEFYNKYGPTEATVTATMYKAGKALYNKASMPIGKPIANTKAYVLDTYMKVVPIGVAGELYLSGPGLSKGYLNEPELNKNNFIENLFSNEADSKLYRTGDIVCWLPDGNLEFLGRKDHQVKIRGYRIELGEIEAKLQVLDTVQQALVEVKETAAGDKQLVGYLMADETVNSSEVIRHLKEQLPAYMIPQSYVMLEVIPKTPSGKVDRKALPAPEFIASAYVAPATDIEKKLAHIWATILEIEEQKIGTTQNFFEIGGHSLKAINLVNKISETFSVEIPLKEIFQKNTILAIAEIIDDYSWLKENKVNQDNEEFGIII